MAVTKVNEQNFQTEVLQSAETVLVDFYARRVNGLVVMAIDVMKSVQESGSD